MIFNIMHSITIMADACTNFRKFLVEGTKPNLKKIKEYVDRSPMLVGSALEDPRRRAIHRPLLGLSVRDARGERPSPACHHAGL
jgi:hypothetical protein